MGKEKEVTVITDTNVLIDYAKTNASILERMSGFFSEVMVPVDILKEADEFDHKLASEIGFSVYTPGVDAYYFASNTNNGLSFEDNICMFDARENGWAVITSDKRMKKKCEVENVQAF